MINPITYLLLTLIDLYFYVVIFAAVMSWLVAFNVINTRNRFVYVVGDMLYRATEPALRPIRQFLPDLGGLDISPVILLVLLQVLRQAVVWVTFRFF